MPSSSPAALGGWLRVAPAVIALAWGGNHFVPLLLLYRRVDGYTQVEIDLSLAVYVFGIVPGFVLAGAWSDRYGRKPVMLVGIAIGIVASIVLASTSSSLVGLCAGRFLSGISVAVAMVVGSSWIKELSTAEGRGSSGARRASVAMSLGFGGGAGVAGVLAQWAPWPTVLPYAVQILACLVALAIVLRAAETRLPDPSVASLLGDVRVPPAVRPRFVRGIVPMAPWIFGAAALSFAVGPSLVASRVGDYVVAFATLTTVITLGVGTTVQLASAPIDRLLQGRSGTAGVLLCSAAAAMLIVAAVATAPWAVLVAAPLFGAGYGLCMVTGLTTVQGMATGGDLAGLTAVFYALSYVGFFFPVVLAALAPIVGTAVVLGGFVVISLACAAVSARAIRRVA